MHSLYYRTGYCRLPQEEATMAQKITSMLKGVREYVYPVLQNSAFLER
jgi:hypothetical protein